MTQPATQTTPAAELTQGSAAPDFTLPSDGGGEISLSQLKGKQVVLYFYPKDDTSGCTQESKDFAATKAEFDGENTVILGISKDSVQSHDKFKAKLGLPFALLSDADGTVCETYGVWKQKSMFGKKYMGIERTTFLIGEDGRIRHVWPKVKVEGHVKEVLKAAKS